jgi:hypothetical protein
MGRSRRRDGYRSAWDVSFYVEGMAPTFQWPNAAEVRHASGENSLGRETVFDDMRLSTIYITSE